MSLRQILKRSLEEAAAVAAPSPASPSPAPASKAGKKTTKPAAAAVERAAEPPAKKARVTKPKPTTLVTKVAPKLRGKAAAVEEPAARLELEVRTTPAADMCERPSRPTLTHPHPPTPAGGRAGGGD